MFTPMPQLTSEISLDGSSPPVVHIPREIRLSSKANEVYSAALDEHGPVIIVPRHGRDEYIIDHRYAHEVLTGAKNFIFETAVFDMIHLGFLAVFGSRTFVHDVDHLVGGEMQPRMNAIIDQIVPVFQEYFDSMADSVRNLTSDRKFVEIPDVYHRLQLAVAHAMVVMILGQEHASSKTAGHFAAVATGMIEMTGLHANTHSWDMFPRLWVLYTALYAVLFTIIPSFFFTLAPLLWRSRKEHLANGLAARHSEFVPLFDILLAKHYHGKSGLSAIRGFLQSSTLCVGIIFASIHQTVVAGSWILVKLTQTQHEYLPAIRKEWESANISGDSLNVKKLNQLTLLDSFIREVLRTKGDSWGPVRETSRAIRVGPYVLPKNAICLVLLSRAHTHYDNYGAGGEIFDGFQWQKAGRRASQASPDFLTFGLGRWACPGRQLAIHEIKIMLYMLFSAFEFELKENSLRIIDPMNTTSIAPEATLLLRLRQGDDDLGKVA
ncbi:hypothetical protein NUW58_g2108 [Xylaria curta]|uniref:Uncharacterized protein n=1 Tax=Xylaria curta TaxID=42375 RepID=A0ACC1PHQ5_9PEZI|nr:hypothetical protein NUW58_g2108 [Xylaria curta]